MKNIEVQLVDAFTSIPFQGNPAGLVLDANGLNEQQMKLIAREINVAETAFVFPSTNRNATMRVRYITSKMLEIPFVGHATIALLYELGRLNRYGLGEKGTNTVKIETGAGILTMKTEVNDETIFACMNVPAINFVNFRLQGQIFAKAFGIPQTALMAKKEILFDANLKYVYVPIKNLTELHRLNIDFLHIKQTFYNEDIILFCLFTPETIDSGNDLHSRVVAPLIGFTEEDSFTGSTQVPVCVAARQLGLLNPKTNDYGTEQGDIINRPGRARVILDPSINKSFVKATAAHVFTALMNVPNSD